MIPLPRAAIVIFSLAFGVYHGILGLLNIDHYDKPWFVFAAVFLYLTALLVSLTDSPGLKLKNYKAAFSLIAAMLSPLAMAAATRADHVDNPTTWHVAGIATLMAIIALRQHLVMAWVGVSIMAVQVLTWGGIEMLFNAGIFGALMLVAAAHAASIILATTSRAVIEFREQALETTAATAARTAARNERQVRVEKALEVALPFLNKIENLEGKLSEVEKRQALGLEAQLRDQIRGRHFDSPELLVEISAARERGVEVQVLDDGGLELLEESQRERILSEVATHVSKVETGKLVLRSVADEKWVVTVTASQPGAEVPDLFVRI